MAQRDKETRHHVAPKLQTGLERGLSVSHSPQWHAGASPEGKTSGFIQFSLFQIIIFKLLFGFAIRLVSATFEGSRSPAWSGDAHV